MLSHISIRTRNKISAGVFIIRELRRKGAVGVRQAAGVIIIRAAALGKLPKKIQKISQCRQNCRTVPKMNHCISLYIAEHTRLVPKTEKLSAANQNRVLCHPSQTPFNFVSQSESSLTSPESHITSPESSLRHPRALC